MKLKQISIACAIAFAGISGQALAIAPSVAPQVTVFISGSSAQQNSLGYIASTLCAAGTLDVYYDGTTTTPSGKSHRAYYCTATGTGTSIDGKKVLINDRAAGGSGQGVLPVSRAQAIASMTISTASCGTAAVGTVTIGGGSVPLWSCTQTVNKVPDAGVSDVEPSMFVGINKPVASDPDFNSTDAGNLTVSSELAVVFGIPVTNDLGITNLTRSQVTSILTGNYQDWSQVDPSKSGPITICRRVPGSGTQASANAYFTNFPCGLGPNSGALVPSTAADSVPSGFTVIENSASGNVISCLNTHAKAIGLLGTETQPVAGDQWKFVNLDGIAPTVANAATGKYDYYVEQTIQWRNKTVNGVAVPTADQVNVLNTIVTRSGDPTFLGSGAVSGVAALWTNGFSPSIPFDPTQPVMQGTRFTNTCSPTTLQF